MDVEKLISKGYFPKELPPCFTSEIYGPKCTRIISEILAQESTEQNSYVNDPTALSGLSGQDLNEEKIRRKREFKNRLAYSDPALFDIPKAGLSRNIVKITNPLHQGKLAIEIVANFNDLELLFDKSKFSFSRPFEEDETSEGKRAVKHKSFSEFKEISIVESFSFPIELRTDISKYYPSIYTHIIPWITFGGKERYKRNRALANNDPTKVQNIYGDQIDSKQQWCQNQQTMGIPIGPDTSLIIAELIASHIDQLLAKFLKRKKIDFLGYRYYDDYRLYFKTELDAQVALTELKKNLYDFELKINDKKTSIQHANNELDNEWSIQLKTFYFRPSPKDQKDDLWNFFSLAFRMANLYPEDSVLKFAINKFNFVRIEKENWDFFEALLFRLALQETSTLPAVAKILITYKSIVDKNNLKAFCSEIINRHFEREHDFELSWALWILLKFDIQPLKKTYEKIFSTKCVASNLIALNLFEKNNRISNIDKSNLESLFSLSNLNTKYWLIVYETIYKNWLTNVPSSIIDEHFYFKKLKDNSIYFYEENNSLEPIRIERSYIEAISRKINQINSVIDNNPINDNSVANEVTELNNNLSESAISAIVNREDLKERLNYSDKLIKELKEKVEQLKLRSTEFANKKPYFLLEKRLQELEELTLKEIESETKEDKNLLFDPEYK